MPRTYDSSGRREQARATRRRIVATATDLFVAQGYAATSIAAIAEAAGVATQTVYAAFGTKAALLGEAVGVAMAGDDEPVAIFDRPGAQAVLAASSPAEAAAAFAATSSQLLARAGRLIHAADAAADAEDAGELDGLRRNGHKLRLVDMQRVAKAFDRAGFLRPGVTAALAADLLWAMAGPDAYCAFTVHRGWTTARYERWLAETIEHALFA